MSTGYVHGYSVREERRLRDQATALSDLLHVDTAYPDGCRVLEVGCGVGAQTIALATHSPGAALVAIDRSAASLQLARDRTALAGVTNVRFCHADLYNLPFAAGSFDHIFVCFVLEHLAQPEAALQALSEVLTPDGSMTVIEGDHGSAYFHPRSEAAQRVIECLVQLQHAQGGDALIGRRLYPLMRAAGYRHVHVSPRFVYVDGSRPDLAEAFTRRTFTAMVEGVRETVLAAGLMNAEEFEAGIDALARAASPDGVFCYTFFKAVATNAAAARR
jgi:SAM-dependent methyltransferase